MSATQQSDAPMAANSAYHGERVTRGPTGRVVVDRDRNGINFGADFHRYAALLWSVFSVAPSITPMSSSFCFSVARSSFSKSRLTKVETRAERHR